MIPALVQQLGNNFNKTAGGTTLDLTTTSATTAGNLIVARILFDNVATAQKPIVSNITKPGSETANWVFLGASRSSSPTASNAASGEIWAIQTTISWPIATYTATLDMGTTQKAMAFTEFSGVQAVMRSTSGSGHSTNTTAASATTTGTTPVTNDLAVGFIFAANSITTAGDDTDTTGGSWEPMVGFGSATGNVATNNWGSMTHKVLTSGVHQTLNSSTTLTAGNGSIVAILQFIPEPSITQAAYRFYADGTESGSTTLAAQDTAPTADVSSGDVNLQLRTRLQVTANAGFATDDYQLQWEKNASGTWTSISTSTVANYNSANLTDAAATTNRLTGGTGSFVAGKISEDGLVDNLAITTSNYTELLYSLTVKQADLANGDTLRFRILRNGATTNMTYTQTPTINVIKAAIGGRPKVWTGSTWEKKPTKVYNGTIWQEKPVKVWTGSTWKTLT